jgi:dCMP deaminase
MISWDQYYAGIARAVAARSSCSRRQVGAIIVVNRALVSTGFNGTPIGVTNCNEGGCARCASETLPGAGYDTCLCVHAEQNAIALAARHGTATDGGVLYCTFRSCIGCVKEVVQAGIREIVYEEPYSYPAHEEQYRYLVAATGVKLRELAPPARVQFTD